MRKYPLLCLVPLLALFSLPSHALDKAVTRGEFVVLMWESRGAVPFDKTDHPFADLKEDGQCQAAAWAYQEGLVQGVGSSLFAPERPLTREECATLLRRMDAHLGRDVFLPDGPALCNDYEGVSPWAGDDLYWACITGRMDWLECRLAPLSFVTHEEAKGYLSLP